MSASDEIILSNEQKIVIKEIGKGVNLMGDCVAGSGKTTSVLYIAKQYPNKKIIQITYNALLRLEVKNHVRKMGLQNIEVHTYNSLAVKYYDKNGHNNETIRKIVDYNSSPKNKIPNFDIIIIDEAQDMTNLFFQLIYKFQKDMDNIFQMVILGDKYQGVYGSKGADTRFLTLADKVWSKPFVPFYLSTSYRLTNQNASFINEVMLGYKRITGVRDGFCVKYIRLNVFEEMNKVIHIIKRLIKKRNIKYEDIFILAPSLNSKNTNAPIRRLENELVMNNFPVYYHNSEDQRIDDDLIKNKIVFSTFHSVKGRERKVVIVNGFDSKYFQYYATDMDPNKCPETLYVATTRAKEILILLEHYQNGPLPFLKKNYEEMKQCDYIEFIDHPMQPLITEIKPQVEFNTSPTELVKFIKEDNIKVLSVLAKKIFMDIKFPQYTIDIPSKIMIDDKVEDVSDINGITIPAIFEYNQREFCSIKKIVDNEYNQLKKDEHLFLQNAYLKSNKLEKSSDFVYLSILYISLTERIYNKINQITNHTWLKNRMITPCLETLEKYLPKNTKFEKEINYECKKFLEYGTIYINGRIDAYNDTTVWELKCVDSLSLEHLLQIVIYAWLWKEVAFNTKGNRKFRILNMRTGEIKELDTTSPYVEEIIKILFENKFGKISQNDDNDFINNINTISKEMSTKAKVTANNNTNFFEDSDNEELIRCVHKLLPESDDEVENIVGLPKLPLSEESIYKEEL